MKLKLKEGNKTKVKPSLLDIQITAEDIEESLLQLKKRVGGPKISFRRRM
jgi:predicted DNA-binding antitoxin AbrB/MazE fold protein